MGYFYDKKVLSFIKTEFLPANLQEKTITPQNQTRFITPDVGYSALSKVTLNGLLVDTHQSYTSQTDSTVAYQKITPTGALKYASLDKVGGMSYKSENLIVLSDVAETTVSDLTYSITNGVITLNGTASADVYINLGNITITSNYFTFFNSSVNSGVIYSVYASTWQNLLSCSVVNASYPITNNAYTQHRITIASGTSLTNFIIKPMLVKGTTEPSEFKVGFEGIRNSLVTSVNSTNLSNNDDKYGWGVNSTCYNYRYYTTNKGHQVVGRVDLGSLNWNDNNTNPTYNVWWLKISDMKSDGSNTPTLSAEYSIDNTHSQANMDNMSYYIDNGWINIKNTNCANATELKTALSGVYLYYELATEVIEDITPIDNIDVSGGTTTFNNVYHQAVPSEITYLVGVTE